MLIVIIALALILLIWLLSSGDGSRGVHGMATGGVMDQNAPTPHDEGSKVFAQVLDKSQHARDLGLLEVVPAIYDAVRCYPSWIKRGEAPPLVTEAVEVCEP